MTFSTYGLSGYEVQYWNGSSWADVTGGNVSGNDKVWRKFNFTAITTSKIKVLANASPDGFSRLTEVEAWTPRTNFALASNGATASASSVYASGYAASSVINGDRRGSNAGSNGNWNDAAPANTFPDWVEVDFNGSKSIDEIDVFTLQDNYTSPAEPTETMTFSLYGLTGYEVQYWNGSSWVDVTSGSITGNDKVWRKLSFSPITTTKIRVLTNASPDGWSRLTEVEAWSAPGGGGSSTANINWLVTDQLGTPRMIFDKSGSLETTKRHDYAPFGEELFNGLRPNVIGYAAADSTRQKFTAYEHDSETSLDFAQARYYGSILGRFNSPDPLGGHVVDPQTLNRYVYVRNQPTTLNDPTGLDFYLKCTGNSDTCQNGQAGITTTQKDSSKTFTATMIHSDSKGNLMDQNGQKYTTIIDGAGVHFTPANVNCSSTTMLGVFANGTDPTVVNGSGALEGFTFKFTYSNMAKNQTAVGTFTFNGDGNQASAALERAGYHDYFLDAFNPNHPSTHDYDAIDFRSKPIYSNQTGSGHFTLHIPTFSDKSYRARETGTVPVGGDVHFGESYPYTISGFKGHAKEQ